MSFFGADPSVSHFSVSVRYIVKDKDGNREGSKEQRERREAERAKLKAAGIKSTTYYQYKNNDAIGKERAKRYADKEAARIEGLTGVIMEVCQGCFL